MDSKTSRWLLGSLAALMAVPAGAQGIEDVPDAVRTEVRQFDRDKGSFALGAGSTAYIDGESPSTAFTLDGRYNYPVAPFLDLEGSLQGSFSQAADDEQAVLPLLAETGVKVKSPQYGPMSLFGAAGLGYGAYLGSEELQDGLTLTMPLGGGIEYEMGRLTLQPRFTWRPVVGDDLGADGVDADSWSAILDVEI